LIVHEVIGGKQRYFFRELVESDEAVVGDGGLPAGVAAAFCRDDDDAIGAPGPINGRGGCIFEYVDGGDVLWGDEVEGIIQLDPVDDI
jgi:hypothetical protein